jgi:hypothetical protein
MKLYYKHTFLYKAKYAKHNFEIMYMHETKETGASLCHSQCTLHICEADDRSNWQTLLKAVISFGLHYRLGISLPAQEVLISQERVSSMKLVGYVFARKMKTQNLTCKGVRLYNTL